MKQAITYTLGVLAALIIIASCKDFVVKKITNQTVTVLAPADNTVTTSNSVTFWWNAMDGADSYNLQIVKPNFASAQTLIADTNVTGNKLVLSLAPGNYQWRIKAVNGGGSSQYTTCNLVIDTTSNLSTQLVVPIGPANNYVTASSSITFSWNAISSAEKYNLQINTNPVTDITITNTFYTFTFTPGSYTWKVKAINAFSISQFNVARNFKLDLTPPPAPTNLGMSGNYLNSKVADTLRWQRNGNDVMYDSLYIYNDANLTSINTFTTMPTVKVRLSTFLSAPTLTPSVPYWWRVKSIDSVGNRSSFSSAAAFTLTP